AGAADGTVRLIDVAGGTMLGEPIQARRDAVERLAWSEDGRLLATGGHDGSISIVDVASRAARPLVLPPRVPHHRVTGIGQQAAYAVADEGSPTAPLVALAWSPTGTSLLVARGDVLPENVMAPDGTVPSRPVGANTVDVVDVGSDRITLR